ncbi:MAG TPA: DMT family transporter, partial [Agromyces sp.]
LTVGAFSTAFAYVAGIQAIRMLGTRLSSFLGLSEVIFAAVVAWALLGEAIGPVQALGGLLILAGIVLVKLERQAGRAGEVGLADATAFAPEPADAASARRP